MGRTLYSQAYAPPAPAIRTGPEPQIDVCERWNALNRFDPDSEDFFQGAEYEAFIDPVESAREHAEMAALAAAEGSSDISESTDSAVSDQGSPMAVGSDDPAILIADAYTNRNPPWSNSDNMEIARLSPPREWPNSSAGRNFRRHYWNEAVTVERSEIPAFIPPASLRAPSPGIEVRTREYNVFDTPPDTPPSITVRRTVNITPIPVERSEIPAFIPPASLRAPSPGIEVRTREYNVFDTPPDTPPSITVRRTVNITPIPVGRTSGDSGARSPSPESLAVPPSRSPIPQPLLSPSPPPSVTPRFYSWQAYHVPPAPTSPTLARGNRDGPLTNPRARISFARIDSAPLPIRVTSSVM